MLGAGSLAAGRRAGSSEGGHDHGVWRAAQVRVLARGSFATVALAQDLLGGGRGGLVALKLLPRSQASVRGIRLVPAFAGFSGERGALRVPGVPTPARRAAAAPAIQPVLFITPPCSG